jgi:hypothetical protein
MADELARWAAERAPELLARAEEQAVAALRGALLEAALGAKPEKPPAPPPKRRGQAPETGEGLWAYCVMSAEDGMPDDVAGVSGGRLMRVESGDLAALVSRVPLAEFGEEPLRANLNDIAWLERVAREHERVLEGTLGASTIVPLRLCTIYEGESGVRRMLDEERYSLAQALELLDGHEEWGVKLLVDSDKLEEEARARSGVAGGAEDEPADGGAYILRRRIERQVRETADALAAEVAGDVHARLEDQAAAAVTLPAQNRDLSHHEGDMLLNAAYLVPRDRVEEMRQLVGALEDLHRSLGARLELTGPWPAYNFVPRGGAASLA